MIGAAALAQMKHGARLINAARGELVDDDALIDALESGQLGGAAIDVFSKEPYSGPLLSAPNIVVTPHLAASTDEAQDRAGVIVAEQVAAALDGGVVTNAVNIPSVGARGPRGARPVPAARGERSAGSRSSWRAASRARSRSSTTASSPSATRVCSRSRP